jgi:hypothetical protein
MGVRLVEGSTPLARMLFAMASRGLRAVEGCERAGDVGPGMLGRGCWVSGGAR